MTPEPVRPARTFSVPFLSVPISTVIIIIVAIVGGVDLIVNGNLSPDFTNYIGIVAGSSGLLAIGRGLDSHSKP